MPTPSIGNQMNLEASDDMQCQTLYQLFQVVSHCPYINLIKADIENDQESNIRTKSHLCHSSSSKYLIEQYNIFYKYRRINIKFTILYISLLLVGIFSFFLLQWILHITPNLTFILFK